MSIFSTLASLPSNAIASAKAQTSPPSSGLRFPTSEKISYGTALKFIKYSYDISGTKAKFTTSKTDAHVFLPLPVSLLENLGVNYDAVQLGAPGQLFNAGLQGGGGIDAAVQAGVGAYDKSQQAAAGANMIVDTGSYVFRRLIKDLSPETGAAIDLKEGNVTNPYTIATFQSVTPRMHNLTFRLFPKNKADSDVIKKISDALKYHSLPSRNGLFLNMPEELEIAFFGTDYLYKFARCVINNVSINYNPQGAPAFFAGSGAPSGVELTLSVQEIEQLTKESYEADGITGVPLQSSAQQPGG